MSDRANWLAGHNDATAWVVWAVAAAVLAGLAVARPGANTVANNYRLAALAWVQGRDMYTPGADGWLYPPQAAVLFVPFALLPEGLGEGAWRVAIVMVYAWAVWRVSRVAVGGAASDGGGGGGGGGGVGDGGGGGGGDGGGAPGRISVFFPATLLALPAGLGAMHNGQSNVPVGAMMALAAAEAALGRHWLSAAWGGLGTAVKPLGVVVSVVLGLVGVVRGVGGVGGEGVGEGGSQRRRRVVAAWVVAGVVVAGFPLVSHTSVAYAWGQTLAGLAKLGEVAAYDGRRFADIEGALETLGVVGPEASLTWLRAVALAGMVALCVAAVAQLGQRWGTLVTGAAVCACVVVFNPRSEGNSYVIVGLWPSVIGGVALLVWRRAWLGWGLIGVAVCLAGAHLVQPGGKDYTVKPLVSLAMVCVLAWLVAGGRRRLEALRRGGAMYTAQALERQPDASAARGGLS